MNGVSLIKSEQNVMMVTFTEINVKKANFAKALLSFANNKIVIDMICQSAPRADEIDFSFTTQYSYFNKVLKTVADSKIGAPLISSGYCKINLFGEDMVTTCGVAAKALTCLQDNDIELFMITTSDLDISLLIRSEQEDSAINQLNKIFSL